MARLRWDQIESPHKGDLQPIDFDQDDCFLPQSSGPSEEIAGLVERVTFFNEESGFAVLRVQGSGAAGTGDGPGLIAVRERRRVADSGGLVGPG